MGASPDVNCHVCESVDNKEMLRILDDQWRMGIQLADDSSVSVASTPSGKSLPKKKVDSCPSDEKKHTAAPANVDKKNEHLSMLLRTLTFPMVRSTFVTMARFHPWFNPRIRVVSRVLDQELMCALMEKTQDLIRNTKWNRNDEFPRRVVSRCCIILRTCGNKSISPWRNMRTVLAILPMKMSILLETWIHFYGSLMLITFEFACNGSCSFGETLE